MLRACYAAALVALALALALVATGLVVIAEGNVARREMTSAVTTSSDAKVAPSAVVAPRDYRVATEPTTWRTVSIVVDEVLTSPSCIHLWH